MRRTYVVAAALAIVSADPAAAQESKFQPPNLFEQKKPAPKSPAIDWNARVSAELDAAAKPSVVCGMTVVPADPKFDPKIRVAPTGVPGNRGVAFTMRVVEPAVCRTPEK